MSNSQDAADQSPFASRKDLAAVERDIWQTLVRAVDDRALGWRLPVVATRSSRGVRQRIVVLRDVDAERRTMLVHTDARSPKVEQMEADDRVSILFYDSELAVQLSVTATARIHTDDEVAQNLWDASHPLSLKYCLGPQAPGTPSDKPDFNLPERWIDEQPSRAELDAVRERFAVLEFSVRRIDWLSLARTGNLRAAFEYTPDHPDAVSREWLAP